MPRVAASEAAWVALIAILAGWWGTRYVTHFREAGGSPAFYQEYFEPAVMAACGHGFVSAVQVPPGLDDFLRQRTDTFDCASVPADAALNPSSSVYQYAWFYLMWMVALFWMIAGVSWSGLAPLFGVLFAAVIALAYVIFRLAVPAWIASGAAVALAVSTLHLTNLPHLRDYAKAPFMLALFLLLAWMVKHPPAPRQLLAWCAAYGLVLGIGYGFRTDFLASIPALLATVLFFLPGFRPRELAAKLGAIGTALAVFTAVAWPVISYVSRSGGCQWHVVLLGLDRHYDENLGVTPSYYQWLTEYSDEFQVAAVNSALRRTTGQPPVTYCSSAYDAASSAYLLSIASRFPADVYTRALASMSRVMDLPFYLWTDRDIKRSRVGELLTHLAGSSRLAVVVAVLAIGAVQLRWGLFAVFVLAYFGGYPSMQFATRHFFHLEFVGWWAMAFVFWQTIRIISARGALDGSAPLPLLAKRGLAFGVAVAAVFLLPIPVVRAYHDRSVAAVTDALLTAPQVPVLVTSTADGVDLRLESGETLDKAPDATQTALLEVRIDLDRCPAGVPLGVRYDHGDPFADFSATVQPQPPGAVIQIWLVPIFAGFRGLSLGDAPASCLQSVERLQSVKGLAVLPTLTLPANWRQLPKHQRIGPDAVRLWGLGD